MNKVVTELYRDRVVNLLREKQKAKKNKKEVKK